MYKSIVKLASTRNFYQFAGKLLPWLGWSTLILLLIGSYWGLVIAPTDYQQKDSYRIIYIHVPAAWMSLFIYMVMAGSGAAALIWKTKVSEIIANSCAPIGASFTFLALVTGSLWGKPMWGTWWVWDARLTSELILFFLYLGYMALRASFDDPQRADRASAVLAIVGVINVPIIHYSVEWWSTLHQPASVTKFDKPSIALPMLIPLFIMIAGYQFYYGWALCRRLRGEILSRERKATWLDKDS